MDAFSTCCSRPQHLRFSERVQFSARTVIAPGVGLAVDQVGLADEIAWALYGPLVARELGIEMPVDRERARVQQALDAVMARSWVIVNRAPSLTPTAHLAFHPVRDPGSAIRLHPLVTGLLDADFDGDQVAVFLPLTEDAQREAGERLTVAAHLARDPALIETLLPPPEAIWGLAYLGLEEAGLREVAALAGVSGPDLARGDHAGHAGRGAARAAPGTRRRRGAGGAGTADGARARGGAGLRRVDEPLYRREPGSGRRCRRATTRRRGAPTAKRWPSRS